MHRITSFDWGESSDEISVRLYSYIVGQSSPLRDTCMHSPLGSSLSMNLLSTDGLAPRRPELLMSNSITTSSVDIQWTVMGTFIPELPEQFVVQYGLSPEDLSLTSTVVTVTSSSQTYSIQLNSLATGTEYYYRVSSRNEFATVLSDIELFTTEDSRKLIYH